MYVICKFYRDSQEKPKLQDLVRRGELCIFCPIFPISDLEH